MDGDDKDEKDAWPARRRRSSPFSPWWFLDIDEMMRDVERSFSKQFKDLERELPKNLVRKSKTPDGGVKKEIGPIVYGYSVTIGPDGKPVVREFGNVRRKDGAPSKAIQGKREPLVDVVSSDKEVRVIAEIPGVKKESINLAVTERTLTISVAEGDREYYKELELPRPVDPDSVRSGYNNGILEVTLPFKGGWERSVKVRVR